MKAIRLTTLFVFLFMCSRAQQIQFSRNYPFQTGSDLTGAVVQKPDSGFAFISCIFQYPAHTGFVFTSTDKFGDTLFRKSYHQPDYWYSCGLSHSLIIDANSNYIQCGSRTDTTGNRDGFVIKFNSAGDTLWTKTYGGAGNDFTYSMYEADNGNYWVCGGTNSNGNGQNDFWLLVLDTNGNIQLDTTYGTYLSEDTRCGDFTFDGGFLMSGVRGGVPYIVKIDSSFAVEWTQTYNWYENYGYAAQLADSGYVMACSTTVSLEGRIAVLFLDSVGGITSYTHAGFPSARDMCYTKPIVLSDGIVFAGNSWSSTMPTHGYCAKTDFSGTILWQRLYTLDSLSYGEFYDVRSTNDGGFILAGATNAGGQDAWLVKADSLGCDSPMCDGVGIISQTEQENILVFPNPATDELHFVFPDADSNRTIVLFDQLGREVVRQSSAQTTCIISLSALSEGNYFWQLSSSYGSVRTGICTIVR